MKQRSVPHRLMTLCFAALAACGSPGQTHAQAEQGQTQDETVRRHLGEVPREADTGIARALSATFRAAAADALPAVVSINVVKEPTGNGQPHPEIPEEFRFFLPPGFEPGPQGPQAGGGSGFILDREGHVVTNHHVVSDSSNIVVRLADGREFQATLVGSDEASDVALIKIDPGKETLPTAALGSSETLQVGDWVLALGSPLALDFTVTSGIVSAKRRQISGRQSALEAFIQTDAAINPGNSGGPLVDLEGRVVGINTAIFGGGNRFVGYGFAIPIDLAQRVIRDLLEYGYVRRPQLGVQIQAVTAADAEVYGLPAVAGAEVSFVSPDSPAAEAGLQTGDVIVGLEGQDVRDSTDLIQKLAQYKPGDEVSLTIYRDRKSQKVTVELGEFERDGGGAAPQEERDQAERLLGFSVQPLSPQLAQRLGFETAEGVVVAQVTPFSGAANAGLRQGMRVMAVNGQVVRSEADLRRAAGEIEPGSAVSLRVEIPELGETLLNYFTRR